MADIDNFWLLPLLVVFLVPVTHSEDLVNITSNHTEMGLESLPVITSRVDHIIVKEGSSVVIDCNVEGSPGPHFQWYHSNQHLLEEENGRWWILDSGLLNITSVTFDDRDK